MDRSTPFTHPPDDYTPPTLEQRYEQCIRDYLNIRVEAMDLLDAVVPVLNLYPVDVDAATAKEGERGFPYTIGLRPEVAESIKKARAAAEVLEKRR